MFSEAKGSVLCVVLTVVRRCSCTCTDLTNKNSGAAGGAESYGCDQLAIVAPTTKRTGDTVLSGEVADVEEDKCSRWVAVDVDVGRM